MNHLTYCSQVTHIVSTSIHISDSLADLHSGFTHHSKNIPEGLGLLKNKFALFANIWYDNLLEYAGITKKILNIVAILHNANQQ